MKKYNTTMCYDNSIDYLIDLAIEEMEQAKACSDNNENKEV